MLQATPDKGQKKWILILCGWTIVALLFAGQEIVVGKVRGSQVHWLIEGALELVEWYIWAACTPLVIGLAKRYPLMGPRLGRHIALHTILSLVMAPLASATQYFLILALLRFVFHIIGPDVHHFLSSFGVSVLFMSFTGMLTYWLVVGLYQSIYFYQVAMERQIVLVRQRSERDLRAVSVIGKSRADLRAGDRAEREDGGDNGGDYRRRRQDRPQRSAPTSLFRVIAHMSNSPLDRHRVNDAGPDRSG